MIFYPFPEVDTTLSNLQTALFSGRVEVPWDILIDIPDMIFLDTIDGGTSLDEPPYEIDGGQA